MWAKGPIQRFLKAKIEDGTLTEKEGKMLNQRTKGVFSNKNTLPGEIDIKDKIFAGYGNLYEEFLTKGKKYIDSSDNIKVLKILRRKFAGSSSYSG